jgi:hypothetical protein
VVRCLAVFSSDTAQYRIMNGLHVLHVAPIIMALSMRSCYCRVAASAVPMHRFLHSECLHELVYFVAWCAAGVVYKCIMSYMIACLPRTAVCS